MEDLTEEEPGKEELRKEIRELRAEVEKLKEDNREEEEKADSEDKQKEMSRRGFLKAIGGGAAGLGAAALVPGAASFDINSSRGFKYFGGTSGADFSISPDGDVDLTGNLDFNNGMSLRQTNKLVSLDDGNATDIFWVRKEGRVGVIGDLEVTGGVLKSSQISATENSNLYLKGPKGSKKSIEIEAGKKDGKDTGNISIKGGKGGSGGDIDLVGGTGDITGGNISLRGGDRINGNGTPGSVNIEGNQLTSTTGGYEFNLQQMGGGVLPPNSQVTWSFEIKGEGSSIFKAETGPNQPPEVILTDSSLSFSKPGLRVRQTDQLVAFNDYNANDVLAIRKNGNVDIGKISLYDGDASDGNSGSKSSPAIELTNDGAGLYVENGQIYAVNEDGSETQLT